MGNEFIDYQSDQVQKASNILQRIALGDESAPNDCFKTYGKVIWTFCQKFINNFEDAEDLMQEIFIDIWKSAAHFDETKSQELTFIKMISKRRLYDYLRKHYRSLRTIPYEQVIIKAVTNSHIKMQMNVEARSAGAALNKLNPPDNQIIRMSIFEGLSHKEIAQRINLPLGTVKTRIRISLKQIRASLNLTAVAPAIL